MATPYSLIAAHCLVWSTCAQRRRCGVVKEWRDVCACPLGRTGSRCEKAARADCDVGLSHTLSPPPPPSSSSPKSKKRVTTSSPFDADSPFQTAPQLHAWEGIVSPPSYTRSLPVRSATPCSCCALYVVLCHVTSSLTTVLYTFTFST
jgi:hypothetical protein